MQRLFWCGAALMVAAAAGFYFLAEQTNQCPDSQLGRCVVLTYRLATECNPVAVMTRAFGEKMAEAVQTTTGQTCLNKGPSACVGAASQVPAQVTVPPPEPPPLDEAERNHILHLIHSQLGVIHIGEAEEACPQQDKEEAPQPGPETRLLPCPQEEPPQAQPEEALAPAAMAVNEDTHPIMPACREEEEEAPPTMPPAASQDEADATPNPLSVLWHAVLRELAPATREESPGVSETSITEESEDVNEGVCPKCQEDPAYHQQYPGVPHTGPCPHCPSSLAQPKAAPRIEDGGNQTPKKGSKSVRYKPSTLHLPPPSEESEEIGPHSDVDTMEFRPSDAHQGEFDNHPM